MKVYLIIYQYEGTYVRTNPRYERIYMYVRSIYHSFVYYIYATIALSSGYVTNERR